MSKVEESVVVRLKTSVRKRNDGCLAILKWAHSLHSVCFALMHIYVGRPSL
eukprot:m.76587 g.76587  ORF g.76587 m.76587 type:complete len:51 (-) comp14439_c0_seq1:1297-1449(-)